MRQHIVFTTSRASNILQKSSNPGLDAQILHFTHTRLHQSVHRTILSRWLIPHEAWMPTKSQKRLESNSQDNSIDSGTILPSQYANMRRQHACCTSMAVMNCCVITVAFVLSYREEDIEEIAFPPTLGSVERKFLHSLAEQLVRIPMSLPSYLTPPFCNTRG